MEEQILAHARDHVDGLVQAHEDRAGFDHTVGGFTIGLVDVHGEVLREFRGVPGSGFRVGREDAKREE